MKKYNYSMASFDEETISAVSDVLASGKVNQWTGNEFMLLKKNMHAFGC